LKTSADKPCCGSKYNFVLSFLDLVDESFPLLPQLQVSILLMTMVQKSVITGNDTADIEWYEISINFNRTGTHLIKLNHKRLMQWMKLLRECFPVVMLGYFLIDLIR
jgi:hypothetical protein